MFYCWGYFLFPFPFGFPSSFGVFPSHQLQCRARSLGFLMHFVVHYCQEICLSIVSVCIPVSVYGAGAGSWSLLLRFVFGFFGGFWRMKLCLRCWVYVCLFLGLVGLRANMSIRLFLSSFSVSPQDPLRRYIARCRIVVQTTTLCGCGRACWADVVVRLVLDWLAVIV